MNNSENQGGCSPVISTGGLAVKRPLPKIDVRDDAGEVFASGTGGSVPQTLTDPGVAAAAFQAVFFDVPEMQGEEKRLELEQAMTAVLTANSD